MDVRIRLTPTRQAGEGESSAVPLKIRAIKKAASVSEGRLAFNFVSPHSALPPSPQSGEGFICPVSRAGSGATNIKEFTKYESRSNELLKAIRNAYRRQLS
jgi:hypothetical protein